APALLRQLCAIRQFAGRMVGGAAVDSQASIVGEKQGIANAIGLDIITGVVCAPGYAISEGTAGHEVGDRIVGRQKVGVIHGIHVPALLKLLQVREASDTEATSFGAGESRQKQTGEDSDDGD